MGQLEITLRKNAAIFTPRQLVEGTLRWQLDSNPHRIDVSLVWHASARGIRDPGIVETLAIDNPGVVGSKDFVFRLPEGPYSFSGKLVSLTWAVEATCFPGKDSTRQEIVVSPTGHPVVLHGAN